MSLHISDLFAYKQCPRLHWHRKQHRQAFRPFVVLSQNLNTALIEKLQVKDFFRGYQGMDAQESLKALESHEWAFNLRFETQNLRVTIPGIHRLEEGLELYFTSLSPYSRIEETGKFQLVLWVLKALNLKVIKINIMHFNKHYQREDELSLDVYTLTHEFVRPNGKSHGDILSLVSKKHQDYQPLINAVIENAHLEKLDEISLNQCPNPIKCEYFDRCFKPDEIADDSLYYFSHPKRSEWFQAGLSKIQDCAQIDQDYSPGQYAQICAAQNGGLFVDVHALDHWLNQMKGETISFIDFEWDTYAHPPTSGMRPFDVIVFQYSLHILKNGVLEHHEYLGHDDCRESFIQHLLEVMPQEGRILAFNAFGAETLRLKELAISFPKYADALEALMERFDDLAAIFNAGVVYDLKFHNSFTLKKIHQALAKDQSYVNLSIAHGLDAVYHYRSLDHDDDQASIRQALLDYGKMDTLAMVEVYQWLNQLVVKGETDA